jgi:CBS domain-containing protein
MSKKKTKQLLVRDVFEIDRSLGIQVKEDTPIRTVIREFAERGELRGVFVVDDKGTLTGVVTRHDLLAWAAVVIGHLGVEYRFSWERLLRIASATTAKEACHPMSRFASVRPDDPLSHALLIMVTHHLIDVPVLDTKGRIIGDLRLTEVLAKALEKRGNPGVRKRSRS